MGQPDVSMIICTHNPRADYLDRVLVGLRKQTLPLERWELLLIDNRSREPVANRFDIGWQANGRHMREDELGLAPARLRGIAAAASELLIFVDDDNVLAPDYLEQALRVAREFPFLGAWGGSAVADFEAPPAPWAIPSLHFLAIRDCVRDSWSNLLSHNESVPNGAGLCIRRAVAEAYAAKASRDRIQMALGRRGHELVGGEDHALALTSCQMGMGTGMIASLRLTHLIPAQRLTRSYLLRLEEGNAFSFVLLAHLLGWVVPAEPRMSLFRQLVRWCRGIFLSSFDREKQKAIRRGQAEGHRALAGLSQALMDLPQGADRRTVPEVYTDRLLCGNR